MSVEDWGFPGGASGEESDRIQAGDIRNPGSIPGFRRSPGGGHSNPPVFLPGDSHGQRSLVGYSPWGHKDMTEGTACIHTWEVEWP